jgi:ABC-type Mn2+/Zn2+ transport system permease subunit
MSEALAYSLLIGISVGFSAGYVGSLMVLEKMALVGDALSHVALPGIALGILLGLPDPLLGGFAFLFVSAVLIWHLGRVTRLSFETIVGAMFTTALAVGILLTPEPDLLEALFGNITDVTLAHVVVAVLISVVAIFLTRIIYNKLVLGMISEELATSTGVSVAKVNLLYLLLVSLIVAIGIKIVGTLLVGFLVIVPAAAGRNMSSNLYRYSLLSSVFGVASSVSGILIAGYLNLPSVPAGPLVVLSGIAIFLATTILKWRKKSA